MAKSEEKKWLRSLRKGDVKSFEFIFRFYYEPMLDHATRILGEAAEAEEVVQDVFLKIWRDRQKLRIQTSLQAYLYTSVYHACLNLIRKKKQGYDYRQYLSRQTVPVFPADERLYYAETSRRVFDVLERMPERRRTIFTMSRFQGMTYRDIAQKLSLSVKTVEDNMTKALRFLRKNLKKHMEES